MNYKVLADKVRCYKEDEEGVKTMCRAMEEFGMKREKIGEKRGEIRGEKKGVAKEKNERILRLLTDGSLPVQKIASLYDLSVEDVEKIQRDYLNK